MMGKYVTLSLIPSFAIGIFVVANLAEPRLAGAQEYSEMAIDPDVKGVAPGISRIKSQIFSERINLNDPVSPEGPFASLFEKNRDVLDAWYLQFRIPLFTQINNDEITIPELRNEFISDLRSCSSASAHELIINLLHESMETLSNNDYHPVVRYNAMLMLGDLNSAESKNGGRTPPVPMLAALASMLDAITSEDQIDAVRVAALIGILRHVELAPHRPESLSLPETLLNSIIEQMLALVQADIPPEGRTREGHGWMQRQAIEILGVLGRGGENNIVLTSLLTKMMDDSQSISLRCATAQALGMFEERLPGSENALQIISQAGLVGSDAIRHELARIEDWETSRESRGNRNPLGHQGYETSSLDPAIDLQITSLRRRLKASLALVQKGFEGPPGIAALAQTPEHQNLARHIGRDLEKALAALDTDLPEAATSAEKLAIIRFELQEAVHDLNATLRESLRAAEPAPDRSQPEPSTPADDFPDDGLPDLDLPG